VTARRVVLLLSAVLLYYLVAVSARGLDLIEDGRPYVKVMGVGVLLAPLAAIPLVLGELRFGRATEHLARLLDEPADEIAHRPSGRIDRKAADVLFAVRKAEVEEDPEDWRRWFRLGAAYGAAGDTSRGRRALREAIRLQRAGAGG